MDFVALMQPFNGEDWAWRRHSVQAWWFSSPVMWIRRPASCFVLRSSGMWGVDEVKVRRRASGSETRSWMAGSKGRSREKGRRSVR